MSRSTRPKSGRGIHKPRQARAPTTPVEMRAAGRSCSATPQTAEETHKCDDAGAHERRLPKGLIFALSRPHERPAPRNDRGTRGQSPGRLTRMPGGFTASPAAFSWTWHLGWNLRCSQKTCASSLATSPGQDPCASLLQLDSTQLGNRLSMVTATSTDAELSMVNITPRRQNRSGCSSLF